MKFLFVKTALDFPRGRGHDVHAFHMMRALAAAGHSVHLLTVASPSEAAVEGLGESGLHTFSCLPSTDRKVSMTKLQRKFCSYWGIEEQPIVQVANLAEQLDTDAVVAVGLEVLPYLAGVSSRIQRVWYAADEWLWHHVTQIFWKRPSTWKEAKPALIKGAYEFSFSGVVDVNWVVSAADRRAIKLLMPSSKAVVIPNGVDSDHFCPVHSESIPKSCTLWGRLDFGPNIDAVRWFTVNVWKDVKRKHPDAVFDVFGFAPTSEVLQMADDHQFSVIADLPDIREEIAKRQVVVLPFVSGGGIKNKFLEAAAMGMPIVASALALNGVVQPPPGTVSIATSPTQWQTELDRLWNDRSAAVSAGAASREWISEAYSWSRAAEKAIDSILVVNSNKAST